MKSESINPSTMISHLPQSAFSKEDDDVLDSMNIKQLKKNQQNSLSYLKEQISEDKFVQRGEAEKYWSDSKKDLFEIKDYKVNFRMEIYEEWDDLAYLIRRGRVQTVQEEVKMNQKFHS